VDSETDLGPVGVPAAKAVQDRTDRAGSESRWRRQQLQLRPRQRPKMDL